MDANEFSGARDLFSVQCWVCDAEVLVLVMDVVVMLSETMTRSPIESYLWRWKGGRGLGWHSPATPLPSLIRAYYQIPARGLALRGKGQRVFAVTNTAPLAPAPG
jgi:hypothetical protein